MDAASPRAASVRQAASHVAGLGLFELDEETISQVLAAGVVHSHRVKSPAGEKGETSAFFSKLCFVSHSCRPNCIVMTYRLEDPGGGTRAHCAVRAVRPIARGELVTTSHVDADALFASREQRQRYLLCQRAFVCRCAACASKGPDEFLRWPCPRCRPRQADHNLSDSDLTGCCAMQLPGAEQESPELCWRSECGSAFREEEVRPPGAEALVREIVAAQRGGFGGAEAGAEAEGSEEAAKAQRRARNALLAKAIRLLGEDHFATHVLLRSGALRELARCVEPLPQLSDRLDRCHRFLVRGGWPLGLAQVHSTFKGIIARAQAEAKNRTPSPKGWCELVAAAAECAALIEGADSDTAKRGALCVRLCSALHAAQ